MTTDPMNTPAATYAEQVQADRQRLSGCRPNSVRAIARDELRFAAERLDDRFATVASAADFWHGRYAYMVALLAAVLDLDERAACTARHDGESEIERPS